MKSSLPPAPLRSIALLGAMLLLAAPLGGCSPEALSGGPPLSGQALADQQTRTACRQRADEVFNQQNRGDIFRPGSQVNTPYSASYLPGVQDRGLADRYAHEKMVNDCIRNAGTGQTVSPTK